MATPEVLVQNDTQRFQEYLMKLQSMIDSLQRNATVLESITNANDRIERSASIKRECVAILQESEKLEATAKINQFKRGVTICMTTFQLTDEQQEIYDKIIRRQNHTSVLMGAAGTGKTTLASKIIEHYTNELSKDSGKFMACSSAYCNGTVKHS